MSRLWRAALGVAFLSAGPVAAQTAPEDLPDLAIFQDCDDCPEMIALPAGSFLMGSPEGEAGRQPEEDPQHEVTLPRFALGRTEVTVGEFRAFVEATGYEPDGHCRSSTEEDPWPTLRPEKGWWDPGFEQTDAHPVVCVTWDDAKAYVAWLSLVGGAPYRLPSEAEWEYAARAGTTTPYSTGERLTRADANYGTDGCCGYAAEGADRWRRSSAPVASFPANPWGLFDMHANVFEWVEDCDHDSYVGAPTDGTPWLREDEGLCGMRMQRGGAWLGDVIWARSAWRHSNSKSFRSFIMGFRVARSFEEDA